MVSTFLLVPLEDTVVFPNMNVTLAVDVGDGGAGFCSCRSTSSEYAKVGTVAEVAERVRLPGGGSAVALAGLHRGVVGAADDRHRRAAPGRGRGAARRDAARGQDA